MKNHQLNPDELCKKGEALAGKILKRNGYKILKRNYVSKYGEIDIIATSRRYHIHFVEVKYYRFTNWVHPIQAVTKSKQKKIKYTATHFLNHCCFDCKAIQFDIIVIEKGTVKDHVLYAF